MLCVVSRVYYVVCSLYNIVIFQVILCDPGCYRELDQILQEDTKGRGDMEILSLMDIEEGDEKIQ